jgi:hypothetical protein
MPIAIKERAAPNFATPAKLGNSRAIDLPRVLRSGKLLLDSVL